MKKAHAIELLGGSTAAAARALGISYAAVFKWPAELSPGVSDRVLGAKARMDALERQLTESLVSGPAPAPGRKRAKSAPPASA